MIWLHKLSLFGIAMALIAVVFGGWTPVATAASGREIENRVDETLDEFYASIKGSREVVSKAAGILVIPRVYKAGIGIGGKYGEGALKVDGKTTGYYNLVAGSYGFQLGAQKTSLILAFMEPKALEDFRQSQGWKVGADASVTVVNVGVNTGIDTTTLNQPVVAFAFDQKGLMYDLSLEGAKFTKIEK